MTKKNHDVIVKWLFVQEECINEDDFTECYCILTSFLKKQKSKSILKFVEVNHYDNINGNQN